MEASAPARVLVVAHRTAATPALLDAVSARAADGPATFTLLVPRAAHGLHRVIDPEDTDDTEAQAVLELALPLLEEAAGAHVEGKIGDPNPVDAINDAVNIDGYDEIIISTLPARVSRWMHLNLPSKLTPLGLPITTVTAKSTQGGAHVAVRQASASRSACSVDQNASSSHGSSPGANARTSDASAVSCATPSARAWKTTSTARVSARE